MNWTEGSLARRTRGGRGKDLLRRQHQHFARARAAMLAGPRRTSSPSRSADVGSRSPSAVDVGHEPRTKNSAGLRRQQEPQSHELPDKNSHEPSEADNLIAAARARQDCGGPSIADKRRKILQMHDWTGVDIQRPLGRDSDSRRDSKPRRGKPLPWPLAKERAIPQRGRVFGHKYDARIESGRSRHESSPALGNIRVRVGSQEGRFAESSSMGHPSGTRRHDDLTTSPYSQPLSWSQETGSAGGKMPTSPCSTSSGYLEQEGHQVARRARRASSSSSSLPLSSVPDGVDSDDSTMAQVGPKEPVVTASLQAENERWRELVCSSPSSRSPSPSRPVISPGVSDLVHAIPGARQTGLGGSGASGHRNPSAASNTREKRHSDDYEDCSTSSATQEATDQALARVPKIASESMPGFSLPAQFLLSSRPALNGDIRGEPRPPTESRDVCVGVEPPERHEDRQARRPFAANIASVGGQLGGLDGDNSKVRDQREEHEAWMKSIVSDDSSEATCQQALLEARPDASRALQHKAQIIRGRNGTADATRGGLSTEPKSAVGAFASESATAGSSSPPPGVSDTLSFVTAPWALGADGDAESDDSLQANVSESGDVAGGYRVDSPTYRQTRGIEQSSMCSMLVPDINSIVVEPSVTAGPTPPIPADEPKVPFKFAAPKLFVGKNATNRPGHLSLEPTLPLLSNQRKGRPRRAGQSVIRQLPNHRADPIEEFGDEGIDAAKCPQSGSLFGVLETERETE